MQIFLVYQNSSRIKVVDEGLIALAKLPKLEKLTLEGPNDISDNVAKHFTSLKSLELLSLGNLSNGALVSIGKYCLELHFLTIGRGKFLIVNIYFSLASFKVHFFRRKWHRRL